MTLSPKRKGIALASVLWVIAAAGAIGVSVELAARDYSRTVVVRSTLTQLRWRAYGCGETAIAALTLKLSGPTFNPEWRRRWLHLDEELGESAGLSGCTLTALPAGSHFSVRRLQDPQVLQVLTVIGFRQSPDALTDALADWEDSDDEPRALGAEIAAYLGQRRVVPRNGHIQSEHELRLVLGFHEWPVNQLPLSVEDPPVAINVAPRAVLSTLPGIDWNVAGEILALRNSGEFPASLQELVNHLSPESARRIVGNFAALADRATLDPWEWEIHVEALDRQTGLRAHESFLVTPSDRGVSVREYRQW